jgi:hypothetical protein
MRQAVITLIIVMLTIFWSQCKKPEDIGPKPTILKEINTPVDITFIHEKSIRFSNLTYPLLFIDGDRVCVYGYDIEADNSFGINIYNKNLEPIERKYLKIGQGPGDAGGALQFFSTPDSILGADHTQRRISIFSKDFNYMGLIKTDAAFVDVAISPDGRHLAFKKGRPVDPIKEGYIDDFYIVSIPDLKSKKIHTIGPYFSLILKTPNPPKLILGKAPGFHYFFKDQTLYFLDMATYEITTYDLKGNILKKVKVDVKEIKVPPEKKSEWLSHHTAQLSRKDQILLADRVQPASWMIPLEKGFAVVRRDTYSTECPDLHEGDYFDYDLKLIGKIRVPCFRQILRLKKSFFPYCIAYDNGYVYLIKEFEEDFGLEKWRAAGE